MEKGVAIKRLLDSRIFCFNFDFDEWPTNHFSDTECARPFNYNIWTIRNHYRTIFPEDEFAPIEAEDDEIESGKTKEKK